MKHPGKTAAQRRALDEIGSGHFSPPMHPKTRDRLLAEGLIRSYGYKVVGRDRFGEIRIEEFEMPIPVHYQWCQVMSAQFDEEQL